MYRLHRLIEDTYTWQEFLTKVSSGEGRNILLEVIEEGWEYKVINDICSKFRVARQEAYILVQRYKCLLNTLPIQPSSYELAVTLSEKTDMVNLLRGYFRYAYYVALDDPDDIFATVDESLAQVGIGTPSRKECAASYTAITGKHVSPEAVIIDAASADTIADQLFILADNLQSKLKQVVDVEVIKKIIQELKKLNELHVKLTGKNALDIRFIERNYITSSPRLP